MPSPHHRRLLRRQRFPSWIRLCLRLGSPCALTRHVQGLLHRPLLNDSRRRMNRTHLRARVVRLPPSKLTLLAVQDRRLPLRKTRSRRP
jgi:hypothetical protein